MVQVSRDSGVISPSDNGAEEETEDEGEEGGAQEELRVHDTPTLTRCGKPLRKNLSLGIFASANQFYIYLP